MSTPQDKDLVAKRLAYIERMQQRKPGTVDVQFTGQEPEGTGEVNRHGMPSLPVGQHLVRNWPVLDLGVTPEVSRADWRLELCGLVEKPVTLDWNAFNSLPQTEDVSDFHCVTTWSRLDNRWKGVRFCDLAEVCVPLPEARFVATTGYDLAPGTNIPYTTNLPLERAVEQDVLLVHEWEGEPLASEHGGPVRMITPKLYAWKGAKWIRRIEFTAEDQLGFWEVRGYSNTAEPWFEDRFARPT